MKDPTIKSASLAEIRKMKAKGELFHDPQASAGESLGREFWDKAMIEDPKSVQPVLLKLEPEVLEFFKKDGKGHLTRMQNVLRAYVRAHR
ncbi:BrnA antitoxin of type II toxin-antitoxin system [Rhizobium sp. RU35A]|uniref:BrnA antitoxin family protein n=1 Tax=Rhizobium sp. RU35A TaxID=1907414 RepID=UPI000956C23B|nr:BrnA antitoxin family protein [Rhizobium sp. RU35A]SIP96786.1 BrnA antitoxin of type II toxin-antitoxin system [Rhizobium sp. RU35A]